jgi:hypothetical protein
LARDREQHDRSGRRKESDPGGGDHVRAGVLTP